MSNRPVIILGAGGHAKVVLDCLRLLERTVLGVVDPALYADDDVWRGLPVLGDDSAVEAYDTEDIVLANGIGAMPGQRLRCHLHQQFVGMGYRFVTLVHPHAVVGSEVVMGQGVQVMAGVIVQPDVQIGDDVILNTGARVDHDCHIGDHVHIAPGAVLSGDVHVGRGCHVGPGATIIQGTHLGENSVIGAGTVVLSDVPADQQQTGQPPRPPTHRHGEQSQ